MVKSDHIDELAKARADAFIASNPGTAQPTRSATYDATTNHNPEGEKWKEFSSSEFGKQMIQRLGKTKILEHVDKQYGGDFDRYAKMVGRSNAQFDPLKGGEWTHDLFQEGRSNG